MLPLNVDKGFNQRLETVAALLTITVQPDDFCHAWQEVAVKPGESPDFHATLAYLLILARYPHPEELEDSVQSLRNTSLSTLLSNLASSREYSRLIKSHIEFRLVVPDPERLMVDISHTILYPHLSGIQRVVLFLCSEWIEREAPVDFFVMRNDAPRPSLVTPEERKHFFNWTHRFSRNKSKSSLSRWKNKIQDLSPRVIRRLKKFYFQTTKQKAYLDSANRSALSVKPEVLNVLVLLKHKILLPELCNQLERIDFYLSLKRSLPKNRFSMVIFDFTPIFYPEYSAMGNNYLKLLRVVDKISCISLDIEKQTQHMLACVEGKRDVVVETHDLPGMLNIQNATSDKTQEVALENYPYILCVGTIEPRKNQIALLRASVNLMQEGLKYKLIFAGNPGWMAKKFLSALSEAHEQKFDIEMRQSVSENELINLYQNCAFTVFCSHAEGFGLPIVESLRFGKAVVVSERGCMRDIANEIGGCHFIDPDRQESIENAIRLLLTNEEYVRRLEKSINFESWPDWGEYSDQLLAFSTHK